MEKNILQKINQSFSTGKKWWIFSILIVFVAVGFLLSGGQYYNQAVNSLRVSTNDTISLPVVKELPFRLGLDLQGGTHLVYQADVSNLVDKDKADALEGARDVIERRVNVFGVSEPLIQVNHTPSGEYRIIAELAGIKDVDEAIKMIGETPLLEFKEVDETMELNTQQEEEINQYNQNLKVGAEEVLSKALAGQGLEAIFPDYESDGVSLEQDWYNEEKNPGLIQAIDGVEVGAVRKSVYQSSVGYEVIKVNEVRDQLDPFNDSATGLKEYNLSRIVFATVDPQSVLDANQNWKNTQLTGKHLKSATVQFNPQDGTPEVSLEFNSEGSDLFAEITGRNIGNPVAIFLDGFPISTPTVNERITGGKAVISGSFNIQEAKLLAQRLNAGALPVPIELISQKTIGASLGQESIDNSLKAGLIGLLLVVIFMLLYYRLPGLLAILSLAVYGLTILAIFKAIPVLLAIILVFVIIALLMLTFSDLKIFNSALSFLMIIIGIFLFVYSLKAVTLTLSGLAGFILSVGMAVDANVLIFERIKEELRQNKPVRSAMEEGFRRAWPSIRDGNISTIFICFVLMTFGTGSVQGFGTTLFIGISISMFSAIVVTRNLLSLFSSNWLEKHRWLLGVKTKK